MRLAPLFLLSLAACGRRSVPPAPVSPVAASAPFAPTPAVPSAAGADAGASASGAAADGGEPGFTVRAVSLPGAAGPVSLDYLACDRARGRVFIPAGGTGSVDVLDTATGNMTRIEGFPTAQREVHGKARSMGPSSASMGDGVVYVGNRANSEICAIDQARLARGACVTIASSPDGVSYVSTTKELWVTTPRDKALWVLDATIAAKLVPKTTIKLEGEPEGYAVDEVRGLFFTNLEDKDKTLAIDARTHEVSATWNPHCGEQGPRGLAIDPARRFLFVACTDHVEVLDAAHDGAELSKLDTGAGVDNIDYLPARGLVYVAAGKAATLTVAHVDDKGLLTVVARAPTSEGARVVVADQSGIAYVADPAGGRLLVLSTIR